MSNSDIITLNVGGVIYETTRSTLTKYPDSMLGRMFNGSMKPSKLDKDGNIFIDRDARMFSYVLGFLRCGKLSLPEVFFEKKILLAEAEFYQLEPLICELKPSCDKDCGLKLEVTVMYYKEPPPSIFIYGTEASFDKFPKFINRFGSRPCSLTYLPTDLMDIKHCFLKLDLDVNRSDLSREFDTQLYKAGWIKLKQSEVSYSDKMIVSAHCSTWYYVSL